MDIECLLTRELLREINEYLNEAEWWLQWILI